MRFILLSVGLIGLAICPGILRAQDAAMLPLPPAPTTAQPVPDLKPPSHPGRTGAAERSGDMTPLVTVGASLAAVLGAFFLLAWIMRKTTPQGSGILPGEAFEVLGRAPLAGRQQVQLLRCGGKLLLVSVTPTTAETLTEITDPAEVERLAELCHQGRAQGATACFRRVFEQLTARRESHETHEQLFDERFGDAPPATTTVSAHRGERGLGHV